MKLTDLKTILKPGQLKLLKKSRHPGFIPPMLATLTENYFDEPNWIYERKLDGVRCLVSIKDGEITLFSRNEHEISHSYYELPETLRKRNYPDLITDGEIVAFKGKTNSFSKLQGRIQLKDRDKLKNSKVKIYLYLFDICYYNGYRLEDLPLRSRKKILKSVIHWETNIRYTQHRNEKGKQFLGEACKKNWEGIIAKDGESKYVHSRSKQWLKFKCAHGQELVIAGFTEPEGTREGFGSMLVGFYKDGKLHYAGKVGTGFDDEFLREWRKEFEKIEQRESAFVDYSNSKSGKNHWLTPKWVGQFGFTEWTKNNRLRHPRFLGMRDDKKPTEVIKEEVK